MMKNKQLWQEISLNLTRVLMGGYLMLAGFSKVRGEVTSGFGSFYRGSFKGLQPEWLPNLLAAPYGYALPWLESAVGLLLLIGFRTRLMAGLTGAMILSFTVALVLVFGITAKNGEGGGPFSTNYILIAVCLMLMVLGSGRYSVDALVLGKKG